LPYENETLDLSPIAALAVRHGHEGAEHTEKLGSMN
jgi:hypothetical protein